MMARRNLTVSSDALEMRLQELLRPVQPSPRLVQTVRQRLSFVPSIELEKKSPKIRRSLMILGGVLSASLLIITGVRAIFYLVNRARA